MTNQDKSNPAPTQHSAESSPSGLTSVQNVEGQKEEVEPDAERRLMSVDSCSVGTSDIDGFADVLTIWIDGPSVLSLVQPLSMKFMSSEERYTTI